MMTTRDPDTDELMTRSLRGEAGAAESLLDRHRDRLRRMIAARLDRRIRSRVDPSDVVQEALAAAARGLPGYLRHAPLPFFAWLRQFARERLAKLHRHHIGARRRSVAREERPAADLPDDSVAALTRRLAADGTSPSQGMIREEVRQGVRAALARLADADRELLLMRNVERLAMADLAAVLGISEGAARVRHLRALRRLRSHLERGTS
jgi:RNA polymerase sigma-70 factor (ECF subfamily)